MNRLIIFASGLAAGAVGGYLVTKELLNAQFEKEYESLQEYYNHKLYNMKEATQEDEEPKGKEKETKPIARISRVAKPDAEVEPDYDEIIEKLNYNQYSTKVEKTLNKKPYIISVDEFMDNANHDKKIYSYFPDDDVVMDSETDEVVDNVEMVLGTENLEVITMDDNNEVYIRNETYGCDYQIILESGSYEDYMRDDF